MDKKQLAEEEIKRALLLMKYDSKKTLTENVEETEEMNEYFAAVAPLLRGAASLGGKLLSKIPWLRSAVTKMGGGTNIAKNVAIQGGIFGASQWLGNVVSSGGDSFEKTKAFFEGCDAIAKDLKPTLDASKHRASAEKIFDAIDGIGTKLPNVKVGLRDMTTVADICAMRKYYNDTYGDLYNDLDGDIDGNDFTTYVWSAIEPQVTNAQTELSKVSTDPDNKGGTGGGGTGGGGTGGGGGRGWRTDCTGTYSRGCKSEKVREVQRCLGGLVADGLFGPKTESAVKAKLGTTTFTDADVAKLCGKSEVKPEQDDFETLDGEDPNEL